MSVRLRLTRIGGRKDPVWRIVAADQRSKRDGRVIEILGHYNAQTDPSTIKVDEKQLDRIEAIVLSMTPEERRRPQMINGSRRARIAKGSGTSVQQVNGLIKQFAQMRKVMKQLGRGRMPDLGAMMRQGGR